MKKSQIEQFFRLLAKENPAPKTELIFQSPFQLLVAVMLSAQATDKSVNQVTPALFSRAATAQQMLKLGEKGIASYISSINFYKTKAKHIFETSQILCAQFHGEVPDDFNALLRLPGVGRKTANVVLNAAFGQKTIAVDTHIFRVANRTGLAKGKNVLQVEQKLIQNIPSEFAQHAHHWLILLGRYTCKARKPLCLQCSVRECCLFSPKNLKE